LSEQPTNATACIKPSGRLRQIRQASIDRIEIADREMDLVVFLRECRTVEAYLNV
jgi:hypothetical protein